jgi:hypothetical protein
MKKMSMGLLASDGTGQGLSTKDYVLMSQESLLQGGGKITFKCLDEGAVFFEPIAWLAFYHLGQLKFQFSLAHVLG